jgi:hypothetical protein
LSISLLEKTPIARALSGTDWNDFDLDSCKQLKLFD